MFIVEHRSTGKIVQAIIQSIEKDDYNHLSKDRYWFNWREEKKYEVYKLTLENNQDILGLIALERFPQESRIQIRLLAVSKENRGTRGQYLNIAGDLIAYAAHQAHQAYGEWACISLVPKTELINHYMNEYSFRRAGTSLYLDGTGLVELINRFNHD